MILCTLHGFFNILHQYFMFSGKYGKRIAPRETVRDGPKAKPRSQAPPPPCGFPTFLIFFYIIIVSWGK